MTILNNIKYRRPSTAGDTIDIEVAVKAVTSVIFTIQYIMKIKDTVIFTGESDHCVLGKDGKIIPLNDKHIKEFTEKLKDLIV